MDSYIQQRAPNKLFVETFVFLREKAKRETALLECFQIVVDCLLNHEASRPEEHFNGSEARLEFFGNMLKYLVTGAGFDVPPLAFHFHEDSFRIPEIMLQQLKADEEVHQVFVEKLEERSETKPSRKERGILNIHQLQFDPESLKGLLDDEPSRDFEAVHVAFPKDDNAMGVDVEDEQGNKLVWRDGKSYIIFAAIEPEDNVVNGLAEPSINHTEEPQTDPTEISKQPKDGFGFDYSDDEDDSAVDVGRNEDKIITDETVPMVGEEDQPADKSNKVSSDPAPYLYIPSSPPMSVAGGSLHPHPPTSSSQSSPPLPILPDERQGAETARTNSTSSSPSSRKRKAVPRDTNKEQGSTSSEEEDSAQEDSDPPVKRKCRKGLSSNTSSSRSTTPVEAELHGSSSALVSPLVDVPPLSSSSVASKNLSSSSTSSAASPAVDLI